VASDQLVFFASGLLGFGPSVAVLFHALRTYDYPYTEKAYFDTGRVFLALAVGMILGTASGALTLALSGAATTVLSLVVLLILLALFEEAFKLIYLNRKGYRGRFDTTFVGVTLGVEHFGQSGSIPDLYRHYGIDANAIVAAAQSIAPGRHAASRRFHCSHRFYACGPQGG